MYIKLTRFDKTPVWLNAAFVVTVESRRHAAGSIVVPIGDGLDYEVRETPEQVLAMLEGAPVAAVVPVPQPKSLTKAPADVSAEPMTMTTADVLAASDIERTKDRPHPPKNFAPPKPAVTVKVSPMAETAPVKDVPKQEAPVVAKDTEASVVSEGESVPMEGSVPANGADAVTDVFANVAEKTRAPEFTAPVADGETAAPKKAKKTARKPRAKKSDSASSDGAGAFDADQSVPTAEQIERLRKMAPGSVKKLANTITSQLKLAGPDSIIDELARQGVLTLDHDHVIWN